MLRTDCVDISTSNVKFSLNFYVGKIFFVIFILKSVPPY